MFSKRKHNPLVELNFQMFINEKVAQGTAY